MKIFLEQVCQQFKLPYLFKWSQALNLSNLYLCDIHIAGLLSVLFDVVLLQGSKYLEILHYAQWYQIIPNYSKFSNTRTTWVNYREKHGLWKPGEEFTFTTGPKIHSHSQIFRYGRSIFSRCLCPNVSTTPLRQWGFQQCSPFSWTTLRGKHCRHPIAVMGVVDTFGH